MAARRPRSSRFVLPCLLALAGGFGTACSSSAKRETPELSRLEGKKVALIEVDGEATSRKVVETALVNQLIQRGTFDLLSKQEVERARVNFKIDPSDGAAIAKQAGADYALRARVLEFDAQAREGYSEEEIEDSQMAAEKGEAGRKTKRLYKVRSLTGNVRVQLEFIPVSAAELPGGVRIGVAKATNAVTAEARTGAAHLPPRLRFLEELSNAAFRDFFDEYR